MHFLNDKIGSAKTGIISFSFFKKNPFVKNVTKSDTVTLFVGLGRYFFF